MRRNKLDVCLHFVWATWDRLPLITDNIQRDLYRYIETVCHDDKCEALAIGGVENHVHLLVLFSNTVTLAAFMNHVKGGSSRFITETLKPGMWFAWQSNYGTTSVCQRDRQKIVRYIENQKPHHANGTFWPDAEETDEQL